MQKHKPQGAEKQGKPRKEENVKKEMNIRGKDKKKEGAPKGLTRKDQSEDSKESIGAMGSGQRQDDN